MRKIFLILTLALAPFLIIAQIQIPFQTRISGIWIESQKGQAPVNIDTIKFDEVILSKIEYPIEALKMQIEGDVIASIDIDQNGELIKYQIKKDIGADTEEAVTKVLSLLPSKWTPAVVDGNNVESRVNILFRFHLDGLSSISGSEKYYKSYAIMAMGNGRWVTKSASMMKKKTKKKKS